MFGYNLHSWAVEFRRLAIPGGVDVVESSDYVSDGQICKLLDNVLAEIQSDFGYLITWSNALSLTATVAEYDLPYDHMGRDIESITLAGSSGRICNNPLQRVSEGELQNNFRYSLTNTVDTSDGPTGLWALSDKNKGKFWVRATSKKTIANGIILRYSPMLENMRRVVFSSLASKTATVTKGSPTVTLSATGLDVEVGDDFGVISSGLNFDGTDSGNTNPISWYRVKTFADPVVTLTTNYLDASGASKNCIFAQTSPISRELPQMDRFMPVHGALFQQFQRSRPKFASEQLEIYEAMKLKFIPSERGARRIDYGMTSIALQLGGIAGCP